MTSASRRATPTALPPWTLVPAGDPRERPGAVEPAAYVSAEWARTIKAASNRAWTNAAKVIARIVDERPGARYVEGWAFMLYQPVWHAWVDVPLDTSERSWLRIDATPMWRWGIEHNRYGPVIEVTATAMAPFVAPLLQPRGRARCRLPLVALAPEPPTRKPQPQPASSFEEEFGSAVAARAAEIRASLQAYQQERLNAIYTDGRAELDRLAAMRVLPERE